MASQRLRVAVAQVGSVLFDNDATLARLADSAKQASDAGAQFVLFPEAFIGGYPKGFDFGVKLGQRSDAGRDLFARYFAAAIEIDGPEVNQIKSIASQYGLHLATGAIEREGNTLYCAMLLFGSDGALLGHRRKLQPTALERVVWGMGTAKDIVSWPTELGRVGVAICWENYMPLFRAALYGQGVQIYCAPTVDDRETWLPTIRHIAVEGRCFVLSACQYFANADLPGDLQSQVTGQQGDVLIRGGSAIVDPFGRVLAGPVFDRPALLTAELDLTAIVRGKFDLDVAGHYARSDLFQLKITPPVQDQ
jgi:nitrilase